MKRQMTNVAVKAEKAGKGEGEKGSVVAGEFRRVAVETIAIGKSNPRKTFILNDLLETIPQVGILQALLVRPLPKYKLHEPDLEAPEWRILKEVDGGAFEVVERFPKPMENPARMLFAELGKHEFELVAGERRLRAARELLAQGHKELAEVPVNVRPMTDKEAWEIQQIENLGRKDLLPIEEAEGFARLIQEKIYGDTIKESVAALCEKLGCSRSHVYGRLALLKLAPTVRQRVEAGELDHCLAVEISKVPGDKAQKALLDDVADRDMSVRELRREVERRYMKDLEKAPFDTEVAMVVSDPGKNDQTVEACTGCPARSGNMLEEYPDLKGRPNVCTNVGCYERKALVAARAKIAAAKEKGLEVIEPGSATHKEMFRWGDSPHTSAHVNLTDTCWEDSKNRTYGELLKKTDVKPIVTVAPSGREVKLVPRAGLKEKLKQAGLKLAGQKSAKEKEEDAKAKEKKAFEQRVTDLTALEIIEQVQKGQKSAEILFLRYVIGVQAEYDGDLPAALKRRGIEIPAGPSGCDMALKPMDAGELRGLAMELYLQGYGDGFNEFQLADALAVFPVNRKEMEARVKCEMAAKEKAAKAAGEKGGKGEREVRATTSVGAPAKGAKGAKKGTVKK